MPLITITGQETPAENIGRRVDDIQNLDTFLIDRRIRPDSSIVVEAFDNQKMHRSKVFEGFVSEALSLHLDPGWYRYKCVSKDEFGEHHQFVNQFFVQMTYDMFKRYAHMRPVHSRIRQTSHGPVWSCGYHNCKKTMNNRWAAVDHEKRHLGETVFQDVPWQPEGTAQEPTSKGIRILGGPPEGAIAHLPPKKAVVPPQFMVELERERTASPEPPKKRRGRPPKKRVEEPEAVHA